MTSRRRIDHHGDSLDLLLDTVCNAFGGIVFLCVFLALTTSEAEKETTDEPPTDVATSELLERRQRLQEAQATLDRLRAAAARRDEVQSGFASVESAVLAAKLRAAEAARASIANGNAATTDEMAKLQVASNALAETMAERSRQLMEEREQLRAALENLQDEVASRTRTAAMPAVGEWNGRTINWYLKASVLCCLNVVTQNGIELDARECRVVEVGGARFVEPVLSAGTRIAGVADCSEKLRVRFGQFDRKQHLMRVWLCPDSHKEWQIVRQAMIESEFRYELSLIPSDEKLMIGGGAHKSRAQ